MGVVAHGKQINFSITKLQLNSVDWPVQDRAGGRCICTHSRPRLYNAVEKVQGTTQELGSEVSFCKTASLFVHNSYTAKDGREFER
jgi:hypothetical protein